MPPEPGGNCQQPKKHGASKIMVNEILGFCALEVLYVCVLSQSQNQCKRSFVSLLQRYRMRGSAFDRNRRAGVLHLQSHSTSYAKHTIHISHSRTEGKSISVQNN